MTLKNAKWRFEEMGCEVTKAVLPYKYRYRRLGSLAWRGGDCLEALLVAARVEFEETRYGRKNVT